MADYTDSPERPPINPAPQSTMPRPSPAPTGWGMVPALGAVAVVGIVALVAWGVMNNDANTDNGVTLPDAAVTQPAADPAVVAPTATPDATAAPEPMVQPEPVPQEVPEPAPEAVPVPTPAPAPAPSN
jgi:hypothetical protein